MGALYRAVCQRQGIVSEPTGIESEFVTKQVGEVADVILENVPNWSLTGWNDAPIQTQAEVERTFKEAADSL